MSTMVKNINTILRLIVSILLFILFLSYKLNKYCRIKTPTRTAKKIGAVP